MCAVVFTEDNGQIMPPQKQTIQSLHRSLYQKRIAQLTLSGVSVLFAHNPIFAMGLALVIFKQTARGQLEDNGKKINVQVDRGSIHGKKPTQGRIGVFLGYRSGQMHRRLWRGSR